MTYIRPVVITWGKVMGGQALVGPERFKHHHKTSIETAVLIGCPQLE